MEYLYFSYFLTVPVSNQLDWTDISNAPQEQEVLLRRLRSFTHHRQTLFNMTLR